MAHRDDGWVLHLKLLGIAAGKPSRQALSELVLNKRISIRHAGTRDGQSGYLLALVLKDELSVNHQMVSQGYALYRESEFTSEALSAAQEAAKKSKIGLWGDGKLFAAPEEYTMEKIAERTLRERERKRAEQLATRQESIDRDLAAYYQLQAQAEPILQRATNYFGGKENLARLRQGHAVLQFSNTKGPYSRIEAYWSLPDRVRYERSSPRYPGTTTSIFREQEGWRVSPEKPGKRTRRQVHSLGASEVAEFWQQLNFGLHALDPITRDEINSTRTAAYVAPRLTKVTQEDGHDVLVCTGESPYHSHVYKLFFEPDSGKLATVIGPRVFEKPHFELSAENEVRGVKYPSKAVVGLMTVDVIEFELLDEINDELFTDPEQAGK
nr:thermonuclease family protein [Aeoliella straminimaris]